VKPDYRLELTPNKISPPEGWKAHTYYLVEVSFGPGNPVHLAIFAVGFLGANSPEGIPGNYSEVWCNSYDHAYHYRDVYYLKAIKELITIG